MLEGQNGLTWPKWQRIARAVEDLGFAGLYRSDHFTNASGPDIDSLELWTSRTWLASHTQRIAFGPIVTPVSFRHPVFTARIGKDVDDLSGGRLTLGVGAGWQVREHNAFGFDLLEIPERMRRFQEGVEVISRLLHSETPVSFDGEYYHLRDAILLPRPQRPGGPSLLIGGNGPKRTLPLAAQYADEWNGVFITAEKFAELTKRLDELAEAQGRVPSSIRRSLMTGSVFGATDADVAQRLEGRAAAELRERGIIVGTPEAVVEQLGRLAEVGVQRLMLQWLDLDDMTGLETLAVKVLPHFR